MNDVPKSPKATANELLAKVIKPAFGGNYLLPIPIKEFAQDYTRQRFPSDPITEITGDELPGFEGLLRPNKTRTKWQIIYNTANSSSGRIRFTQAHEFGHYLLHRKMRERFECSDADMVEWDAEDAGIEKEADEFAATFLMPMDDLRAQVDGEEPSFDLLRYCANRYDVSLMAAMLKWIELAPKRAIVLAVRDDHVLWARSNRAAFLSGTYLAARKMTIPVPLASVMHSRNCKTQTDINKIPTSVWFKKESADMPLTEMSFVANQYGITLGILLLPDAEPRYWNQDKNEADDTGLESTIDFFERRGQTIVR
jgi:Zn-dependent peptidase ImmA (M78 family)